MRARLGTCFRAGAEFVATLIEENIMTLVWEKSGKAAVLLFSGVLVYAGLCGNAGAVDLDNLLGTSRDCILHGMLNPSSPLPPHCLDDGVDDSGLSDEVLDSLVALRRAMTPFYSFDVATAAGWDVPLSECVESPFGGMGYHYANLGQLTNGGKLSLMRPEVLLYAPTEDGSMEFLGVEYIIPAADWTHAEPPMFLGEHLHFNPMQDIWALHVWVARHNPTGIFEDWNPEVHCDFAED